MRDGHLEELWQRADLRTKKVVEFLGVGNRNDALLFFRFLEVKRSPFKCLP